MTDLLQIYGSIHTLTIECLLFLNAAFLLSQALLVVNCCKSKNRNTKERLSTGTTTATTQTVQPTTEKTKEEKTPHDPPAEVRKNSKSGASRKKSSLTLNFNKAMKVQKPTVGSKEAIEQTNNEVNQEDSLNDLVPVVRVANRTPEIQQRPPIVAGTEQYHTLYNLETFDRDSLKAVLNENDAQVKLDAKHQQQQELAARIRNQMNIEDAFQDQQQASSAEAKKGKDLPIAQLLEREKAKLKEREKEKEKEGSKEKENRAVSEKKYKGEKDQSKEKTGSAEKEKEAAANNNNITNANNNNNNKNVGTLLGSEEAIPPHPVYTGRSQIIYLKNSSSRKNRNTAQNSRRVVVGYGGATPTTGTPKKEEEPSNYL